MRFLICWTWLFAPLFSQVEETEVRFELGNTEVHSNYFRVPQLAIRVDFPEGKKLFTGRVYASWKFDDDNRLRLFRQVPRSHRLRTLILTATRLQPTHQPISNMCSTLIEFPTFGSGKARAHFGRILVSPQKSVMPRLSYQMELSARMLALVTVFWTAESTRNPTKTLRSWNLFFVAHKVFLDQM